MHSLEHGAKAYASGDEVHRLDAVLHGREVMHGEVMGKEPHAWELKLSGPLLQPAQPKCQLGSQNS